jgi:hypothetical protein
MHGAMQDQDRNAHKFLQAQEPEAKGQVVGRMGVGVTSRGAGGLDTAQPVGKAVGCAIAGSCRVLGFRV